MDMDNADLKLIKMVAKDVMSDPKVTVSPHESLSRALSLMDKYRRYEIPVLDGDELVGLISYSVLGMRRNLPLSMPVERVMYPAPSIPSSSPIPEVSEILLTDDYRSVPITEDSSLCGMVTRRDIIRKMLDGDIFTDIPTQDVMTSPVTTVEENESLSKAIHEMYQLEERSLPVVDSLGRLSGIITLDNLDHYLRGKRVRASQGEIKGEKISPRIEAKSAMLTPPVYVGMQSHLGEVMNSFVQHRISTVLVVDDDNIPRGIVTSLDIIELAASARPRKEVLVQISGFEADDPYIYDSIYEVVQRYLPKIANHVLPRMINFHITHHHHQDSMTKFTINGRMSTPRKTFLTSKNDWDLLAAMDEVMGGLLKQVKKYKDKVRDHH